MCRKGKYWNGIKLLLLALLFSIVLMASAKQKFEESKVQYIDNGVIKLGVSQDLGGAITYIADSKNGKNIINNWDWGRQIQMSFFSGPVPYTEKGQKPKKHWEHIGWNPIQAGDDHGNGSKVIKFKKKDTSLPRRIQKIHLRIGNIMAIEKDGEALRQALTEEMDKDENVILIGQDIAILGGAYQVTF